MKNMIIEKIKNKKKNIIDFCFGALLLINLIAVPVLLKTITEILQSDGWKNINPLSSFWYEQTKEAKIFFENQNINLIMACCIMASLLYSGHKNLSFLCLIIPIFYVLVQSLI